LLLLMLDAAACCNDGSKVHGTKQIFRTQISINIARQRSELDAWQVLLAGTTAGVPASPVAFPHRRHMAHCAYPAGSTRWHREARRLRRLTWMARWQWSSRGANFPSAQASDRAGQQWKKNRNQASGM
jgi:hypothetical protein